MNKLKDKKGNLNKKKKKCKNNFKMNLILYKNK